jgi:stage II sporulation protein R
MKKRLGKELRILAISLAVGLGFALLVASSSHYYAYAVQRDIADSVLRFHVMAHSNHDEDQALKEAVRLAVLTDLGTTLTGSASIEITRGAITDAMDTLIASASQVVSEAGFDYPVTAEITRMFFPTVAYGDLTFPPGPYETLLITIGEGAGRNWWCLMFPPLCYVEMTSTEHTRDMLEQAVPQEGFALLTHQEPGGTNGVAVRFRLVEWWQNRRQPTPPAQNMQRAGR